MQQEKFALQERVVSAAAFPFADGASPHPNMASSLASSLSVAPPLTPASPNMASLPTMASLGSGGRGYAGHAYAGQQPEALTAAAASARSFGAALAATSAPLSPADTLALNLQAERGKLAEALEAERARQQAHTEQTLVQQVRTPMHMAHDTCTWPCTCVRPCTWPCT